MTERRCPTCGGLVGADAEWCTQCFTRLNGRQARPGPAKGKPSDEETPSGEARQAGDQASSAPRSAEEAARTRSSAEREAEPLSEHGTRSAEPQQRGRGVRAQGEEIVWDCPACGTENPIDVVICPACGTPFGQMLQEPKERVSVDPGRAAMLSLFFPGAGHWIAGRRGEGIARGIVFAFALVTGLSSLVAVRSGSSDLYVVLMVLALAAAGAMYVVSTMDAGRAAQGVSQLLGTRVLLYGAVGLMLATLVLLTLAAMQARG